MRLHFVYLAQYQFKNLTKMVKPLILRNKDICIIFDCAPSTSSRTMTTIKDALKKAKHQKVSLSEFCNYYGLSFNEVIDRINQR